MFKRVKAGLHRATLADGTYELQRELDGRTSYIRKWTLYRTDGIDRECMDTFIDTIADGEAALDFILRVEAHLQKLGATEGGLYKWTVQTRLGPLHVSPHGDRIMMRFGDIDRAKVELGDRPYNCNHFNPYSGKWNMHWGADSAASLKILSFESQLDRVMGEK